MDIRRKYQITEYCHHILTEYIREGDCCVDATAGNGHDTAFLCGLVGPRGKVYAFDIQGKAIGNTLERLKKSGYEPRAQVICDGHENMGKYVKEEVSAVLFNLGYLPGGDHSLATKAASTLEAVKAGMKIVKTGGVISLCIYSGGDTGYEERDALLSWMEDLDPRKWLVIVHRFYNRKNDPPMAAFIIRLEPDGERKTDIDV